MSTRTPARMVTALSVLMIAAAASAACGSDRTESTAVTESSDAATATAAPTSAAATTSSAAGLTEGGPGSAIVPSDGFESGLALFDEGLEEADDDGGRQLFVFTSVGADLYQVQGVDSSGELEPMCWQMPDPNEITPSAVVAGDCDADLASQQFTIVASGAGYVISHEGDGYLKTGDSGIVLSADDPTTFIIVDQ